MHSACPLRLWQLAFRLSWDMATCLPQLGVVVKESARDHMAALSRYYTQRRLVRASKKLGIPDLAVRDQLEDRRVGLRMVVFTGPIHDLGGGMQV